MGSDDNEVNEAIAEFQRRIARCSGAAEAWYAFAVKLFADQNRFMDEISKTIAMRDKNE